jgi:hypothetical protein
MKLCSNRTKDSSFQNTSKDLHSSVLETHRFTLNTPSYPYAVFFRVKSEKNLELVVGVEIKL